ncbi:unnamed protein product [Mytilus coruscus]|uniref:QRICH1-like domain-containing protein n=1 Tax=Mytilus coruscus TaxID=42192 RepID=A0A6J8DBG2_MYTCO|nr:unnamed protein product [Mytilus coruscus]
MDAETMNTCLQRFVVEERKQDGLEYPPKSLYYIICGLLRHLRDEEIHDKNFLNENDIRFAVFCKVLNAKMKELASRGLGSITKQADPITKEDEEQFGILECLVVTILWRYKIQFSFTTVNCLECGVMMSTEIWSANSFLSDVMVPKVDSSISLVGLVKLSAED